MTIKDTLKQDTWDDGYGEVGVTNIENPQILSLNPFAQIAKRPRIMKGIFKSPEEYNEAVKELENELYNVG